MIFGLNASNRLFTCYLGCETGTYTVNCSKTCNHCKNNETCDIDTGECDGNGCAQPGFESPMCSGKLLKEVQIQQSTILCSVFSVLSLSILNDHFKNIIFFIFENSCKFYRFF